MPLFSLLPSSLLPSSRLPSSLLPSPFSLPPFSLPPASLPPFSLPPFLPSPFLPPPFSLCVSSEAGGERRPGTINLSLYSYLKFQKTRLKKANAHATPSSRYD